MTNLYAHVVSGDIQSKEDWMTDIEQSIKDNYIECDCDMEWRNGYYQHPGTFEEKLLQDWIEEEFENYIIEVNENGKELK